jgi:hypothetical protein
MAMLQQEKNLRKAMSSLLLTAVPGSCLISIWVKPLFPTPLAVAGIPFPVSGS